MNIPGLDSGKTTMNLVVKSYGMMRRGEIPIPSMINDDCYLQEILLSYGRGLELAGYAGGVLPWMERCKEGMYSDEILMNAGIASIQLPSNVAIMRSNGMAQVMTYCTRLSEKNCQVLKAVKEQLQ